MVQRVFRQIRKVDKEADITVATSKYPANLQGRSQLSDSTFKEKPTATKSAEYIEKGALWNSGVFAYRRGYVLEKEKSIGVLRYAGEWKDFALHLKRQKAREYIMDFQGKIVHTHKTCVHPDFRGFGAGKLLVLAAMGEALKRGCNRWQVEMDEGNTASEEMHAAALGERLERSGVMSEMWTRRSAGREFSWAYCTEKG